MPHVAYRLYDVELPYRVPCFGVGIAISKFKQIGVWRKLPVIFKPLQLPCPKSHARTFIAAEHGPNRTHAPSSLQNIRLNSDVANLLSRSQNWRADGDGCVGLPC
jgi:hypothetical protein